MTIRALSDAITGITRLALPPLRRFRTRGSGATFGLRSNRGTSQPLNPPLCGLSDLLLPFHAFGDHNQSGFTGDYTRSFIIMSSVRYRSCIMLPKSDVGSKDNVTERERRDGGGDRASSQELDTTDELTDKIGSRREGKRKREDIW